MNQVGHISQIHWLYRGRIWVEWILATVIGGEFCLLAGWVGLLFALALNTGWQNQAGWIFLLIPCLAMALGSIPQWLVLRGRVWPPLRGRLLLYWMGASAIGGALFFGYLWYNNTNTVSLAEVFH